MNFSCLVTKIGIRVSALQCCRFGTLALQRTTIGWRRPQTRVGFLRMYPVSAFVPVTVYIEFAVSDLACRTENFGVYRYPLGAQGGGVRSDTISLCPPLARLGASSWG